MATDYATGDDAIHPRLRPATRKAITTALVATEATAHGFGWDLQPVLFGLFDHPEVDGTAALEVDPTLAAPDLWQTPDPHRPGGHLPVPTVLHRFAADLTRSAGGGLAARLAPPQWAHLRGRRPAVRGLGRSGPARLPPRRPGGGTGRPAA